MPGTILSCALLVAMLLTACTGTNRENAGCLSCHGQIEHVSASHPRCRDCHGGDDRQRDKALAHRGMFGPRNPAAPATWARTCGACHQHQLRRVASSLMATNAGLIRNIQLTWGETPERRYAPQGGQSFDADGKPLTLAPVAELTTLGGDLYRKFCSRCHVGTENGDAYGASHAAGCGACHFPYNEVATYQGRDPLLFGSYPAAATHRLEPLPGISVCGRCHNRSGRIALSYQGLYDGNNGLVPTKGGELGPVALSGARNAVPIAPDIHFAKGLECIDCHTSRDVMGDGYSYRNMYLQTEVACEDCHGGATTPPRTRELARENDPALRESARYGRPLHPGSRAVLTAKGRPYSNVYTEQGTIYLVAKRTGKIHKSPVITGTPAHTIVGHGRLECYACHSRTVVQCYGCHTDYDRSKPGMDYVTGQQTPGAFSETEDYRTLYPFPLALNQRGRISPVTPGCQTFVTLRDETGAIVANDEVLAFRGKRQLRFAPFYSHNTGVRAVSCRECHGNPQFLGFGQHVASGDSLTPTLLCEKNPRKPLDGYLTLDQGRVAGHAAITREGSRPLNSKEIRRTLAVNSCLICHERADDPIYRRKLNLRALDDSLHSRLLGR
jgi:hypothetical protein